MQEKGDLGGKGIAHVKRVHSFKEGAANTIRCCQGVRLDQEKNVKCFISRAFSMTLVKAVLQE